MNSKDMIPSILTWTSTACYQQIHYFKENKLIFSTLESPASSLQILENPFLCDPELFSTLISCLEEDTNTDIDKTSVYLQTESDNPDICYGILRLEENEYIIIGPGALRKLSASQLHLYIKHHHINDYRNYSIQIAGVPQISALLSLLSFLLTGKAESLQLTYREESLHSKPLHLLKYQLENAELELQHLPYKVEDYFMTCIRDGDLDAFQLMLDKYQTFSVGKLSECALKQEEYSSAVSVSLMARAAIEGGVNPYYAYDMNDLYLQQISSAKTHEEYQQIAAKASKDFIQAVNRSKALQSRSMYTEKCKQYIARHLNLRFTLDDLADEIGLNRTYISELFHQYSGMTLTEYTHRERINAAKNMLRFSDYEIAQIAEYFCFHSQSHFGKIFKKYTGITPLQYRRNEQ